MTSAPTPTRRRILRSSAAVAAGGALVSDEIPVVSVGRVRADTDQEGSLTATATIPDETGVWVTVEEYDGDNVVDSDTIDLVDGESEYGVDLPFDHSEYDFTIVAGSDTDDMPEINLPIEFEVVEIAIDDEDDNGLVESVENCPGIGVFDMCLNPLGIFGDGTGDDDDSDGFWIFNFDFNFWPFEDDE